MPGPWAGAGVRGLGVMTMAALLWAAAGAAGTLSIPLAVREEAGVDRVAEPVLSGLPVPREAQLFDTTGLALVDAASGAVVDAGFVVTARWGGAPGDVSRPVKWVLVAFRCSVAAGGVRELVVTDYRPGPPSQAIALETGPTVWTVDTGPARFELAVSGFDLFRRVTVGGVELVPPSPDNGPYLVQGETTWRAAVASGGSALSVRRRGPRGQTLTLEVRSAHRTFAPGDPNLSDDEDLDAVTRLTFTAGSAEVRIHHTVQNNRSWVALQNNADIRRMASAHAMWFDELGLSLGLDLGESPHWRALSGPADPGREGALSETLSVYQDSSGSPSWDLWKTVRSTGDDPVAAPDYGPSAYTSFRGWELREGEIPVAQGETWSGGLAAWGSRGGVAVAMREMWQSFPKALRFHPDGRLDIALFPAEFRARHGLRVGEQKSHELLLVFFTGGPEQALSRAAAFDQPLVAVAPPAWYGEVTAAVPTVSTTADGSYRFPTVPGRADLLIPDVTPAEWDAAMQRLLEGPGVPGYSFDGLAEARAASELYGWMDWGDLPIDFEGQWGVFPTTLACGGRQRSTTGQYGWKYDGDYGLLVNFLRSGDRRFLSAGLAAARHTADIDMLHHGRQSGRGIADFRDGGMLGHSEHNSDGDLNPHRNGTDPLYEQQLASCDLGETWKGTPTADMLFGVGAVALGSWLTGDPALAEALVDIADWAAFFAQTHGAGGNERATGNLVQSLAWALEATGDSSYRQALEHLVATDPALARPMGDGLFAGRLGSAVGHLVRVLREADDDSLDAVLETVVADAEVSTLGYAADVCRADAHAWGALYGRRGVTERLERARTAFASGALWPAWEGNLYGLSRAWQVKEWMFLLGCGHVYQLAEARSAGYPTLGPQAPPVTPAGGAATQNTAPSAVISGAAGGFSVDVGEALALSSAGSDDAETPQGLTFLWDLGDGMRTTGPAVEHEWLEAGRYTITLWVGDGEAFDRAQATVDVLFVNHPPTAEAGPDRVVPRAVGLRLDARASTDPDGQRLTATWDLGDGAADEGDVVEHTYAQPGIYTVTLTVSDGELADTDTLRVTVPELADHSETLGFRAGENGYDGAEDTFIFCCQGESYTYGGSPRMAVSRQTTPETSALWRFALEGIPVGSRIESATLELWAEEVQLGGAGGATVELVASASDWLEGDGQACQGCPGATWRTRDGLEPWLTGSGGDALEPGPTAALPLVPGGTGPLAVEVGEVVQLWITGAANHGFLASGGQEQDFWWVWFASRETPDGAGRRPRLEVTFTPPRADAPFFADGFESGGLEAWSQVAGGTP